MAKQPIMGLGLMCAWLILQPAVAIGQLQPPAPSNFRVVDSPLQGNDISVLSWNIRIDDSSEAHARSAMARSLAASPRPQIILIQEAYNSRYSIYLDELQRQTGT